MVKKRRSSPTRDGPPKNLRRARVSFAQVLSLASRRAHEQANRKGDSRSRRYAWVADAAEMDYEPEPSDWIKRPLRWMLALLLLPLCWVTTWTFLSRFSAATVDQNFWKSTEFWYFATGALVMIGWFWCGLLQRFFLYLYVLGHELTHAVFVIVYRGKVTDFHVSAEGGYITTNKTNMMIALSPYFVPFWSVVCAIIYVALRYCAGISHEWDRALYAVMGVTWTFHMIWTLWMIPRDQPDLRENGVFLSLVVIYFANLLVLAGLLCLAEKSPLDNSREFALEWFRHAATWSDMFLRWSQHVFAEFRAVGKF